MRWKSKYVVQPPQPGQHRLFRKFAWLPKRIGGDVAWLEFYEVLQAYLVDRVVLQIQDKPATFTVGKWTDVSTRIIP